MHRPHGWQPPSALGRRCFSVPDTLAWRGWGASSSPHPCSKSHVRSFEVLLNLFKYEVAGGAALFIYALAGTDVRL